MADASYETITRLIENSEKGLAQIEVILPTVLETRQVVLDSVKKQEDTGVVIDLLLIVLDILLAENEVMYDLSASLDALLRSRNDYTKRYYMQSLNLCFWEACQVFVGEYGDDDCGLLTKLEKVTKQMNQAGCQSICTHIIDDIQDFRKNYCDKELRNITRHYDDPIKMYEKQHALNDIDFFAKGASQLMAIRMEISVLSTYLLNHLHPLKREHQSFTRNSRFHIKPMVNGMLFKAFQRKALKDDIQRILDQGQASLDNCFQVYNKCQTAEKFLIENNYHVSGEFDKIKSMVRLRMELLFLRYDVACSVWGYLNAVSDKERSQNLRLIHITKQAALTHIYGYNDIVRGKSLWAKIKEMEESDSEKLATNSVEKLLKELTDNLRQDNEYSRMFAHYRYKQNFYIPARLEAFNNMEHHKELIAAEKLLKVCKVLDVYTSDLLLYIDEKQKHEQKKRYDRWMVMIDGLEVKSGNNDKVKKMMKPLRELIDKIYNKRDNDNWASRK